MSATTIFLGRPFGLYLAAISGELLANWRRTLATLNEMARSGPWMLFSGMVATAGGLAVMAPPQTDPSVIAITGPGRSRTAISRSFLASVSR